jgi:hypothetical protein
MSKFIAAALAGALLTTAMAAAPALAQAPAAAAGKLSSDSTVKALLDNPKSAAVLEKYIPIIVQYADMIPDLDKTTLKQMAQNEQAATMGGLTADALKSIEGELAKL